MRFDYGDEVVFRTRDRAGNILDKSCSVVGITPIEREEQTEYFKHAIGTVLYAVEFGDGSDMLVSEGDLLSEK